MTAFHDVLTSAGGWTCTCGDSGPGGVDDADDHVIVAWEVERGLDDLSPWRDSPPMGVPGVGEGPI